MKIYGVDVDEEVLAKKIEEAELECLRCTRFEVLVVLDTETGELYQTKRPCGDSGVSQRVWDGVDRILYKVKYQWFSVYTDWLAGGFDEGEMNDWVEKLVGKEKANEYYKKAEAEDVPMWRIAYIGNEDEFNEAVVEQYAAELMESVDMDAIIERIEEEANREW